MAKAKIIKNILLATLWTAIGSGTIVLLVAAIQSKDAKKCTAIDINIKGVSNNFFVDKNDVLDVITNIAGGKPVGMTVGSFDLKALETALQKNVWVKQAQLFFDNNEKLQVNVLEREPVARVFTTTGSTFYLDSSAAMLPLSEKFSARLPVFTGFPTDKKVLLKADSNLLRDILGVSSALQADSFYMAMIDQVDITPERSFEMIPKFGNTVIVFGDGQHAAEKLSRLQLFYKEVMVKAGWNKYSQVDIQYDNQVVGKRKGAAEVKADSLHTLQLMKLIAATAERLASDSLQTIVQDNERNTTDNSIIQQSIERDDQATPDNTNEEPKPRDTARGAAIIVPPGAPATSVLTPKAAPKKEQPTTGKSKAISKPVQKQPVPAVKQSTAKPKPVVKQLPKIVMPKKPVKKPEPSNEYQ